MINTTTEALIPADLKTVWQTMTDLRQTDWRSDLEKTVVLNRAQFLELDKGGRRTFFTVTQTEPGSRWVFTLENAALTGHCQVLLAPEKGGTRLVLVQESQPRGRRWRLPLRIFLKNRQKRYISDLVQEISRENKPLL